MATQYHNLSDYDINAVPSGKGAKIALVVSQWNDNITGSLLQGAKQTLLRHDVQESDITIKLVPGSFELVNACASMMHMGYDAIIAIGCVIRGDTPHFDYICQGTTQGLAALNAKGRTPVIYGLITTNDMQQALDRAGGKLGNKGDECAIVALKMIELHNQIAEDSFPY